MQCEHTLVSPNEREEILARIKVLEDLILRDRDFCIESQRNFRWLTLDQAAAALQIHRETLSRLAKEGKVPYKLAGKRMRFSPAVIYKLEL